MGKRNNELKSAPPPQGGGDGLQMALLGAAAVVLVGLAIWAAMRGGPAKEASAAGPVASAAPAATMPAPAPAPAPEPPEEFSEADIAAVPRITVAELSVKLKSGAAVTVDVRDIDSFVAGHIPGALQIPLAYVEGEVPWFPKDKLIVPYCTCPAEESSGHAVLLLKKHGLSNVAALKGGLDSWRAAGEKVDTGMPPTQ